VTLKLALDREHELGEIRMADDASELALGFKHPQRSQRRHVSPRTAAVDQTPPGSCRVQESPVGAIEFERVAPRAESTALWQRGVRLRPARPGESVASSPGNLRSGLRDPDTLRGGMDLAAGAWCASAEGTGWPDGRRPRQSLPVHPYEALPVHHARGNRCERRMHASHADLG